MKDFFKMLVSIPNKIYFIYQQIRFKPVREGKLTVRGRVYMYSSKGAIRFGDNVEINSCLKANPIGGSDKTILYAKPGATISIGNRVGISNSSIYAAEKIVIDDYALIGGDCYIYDTDFHSLDSSQRGSKTEIINTSAVYIGKHTFIGAHSIILKGVSIGDNSIVAAGSVVTKDIPANQVWGGAPARFIRDLKQDEDTMDC